MPSMDERLAFWTISAWSVRINLSYTPVREGAARSLSRMRRGVAHHEAYPDRARRNCKQIQAHVHHPFV